MIFVCKILLCVCLLLHLVAYLLVPHLRNLPGNMMASYCFSLLIMYVMGLTTVCCIVGSITIYNLVATWCWSKVLSFEVWKTFRRTNNPRSATNSQTRRKFLIYSLYCWFMPLPFVVIKISGDVSEPQDVSIRLYYCLTIEKHEILLVRLVIVLFMIVGIVNFVFSYGLGASSLQRKTPLSMQRQSIKVKDMHCCISAWW